MTTKAYAAQSPDQPLAPFDIERRNLGPKDVVVDILSRRQMLVSGAGFLPITFFAEAAMAQDTSSVSETNRAIVARAFANWSRGAGNVFMDLLAPDATWTIVGRSQVARTFPTREAFLSQVISPFGQRMARPLVPTVRSLVADGDQVVIHFDGEGVAHDGQPYRNSYAWFFRMRDGRVTEATAFFDSIAFDDLWSRVSPEPAK
ncbi:nuclear transport factor 2 family protein [Labrys okinawensis]|uniref:nuclear transport factor 2 family protein n=1 Tax=Labrys okinawensis TaxID=346911 RepID=UPI0039BC3521